ncbi:MAG: replicative DNA helicase [Firmicutes bacterium]|nr:replicative DNA helicase [Clostridiales bacterium]MBQ4339787.1 replicative DNA helicase [Bacillota bacterium]
MRSVVERIPPHNEDAEKAVLGASMMDKNALMDALDILRPDDFYKEAHKEIFSVLLELYKESEPVDILTVAEVLKKRKSLESVGGRAYLGMLTAAVISTANTVQYAKIIEEKSILRSLIQASSETVEEGYSAEKTAGEILEEAEQRVFSISQKRQRKGVSHIGEVLAKNINTIQMLTEKKGELRGITTGFTALDNLTSGLQKADLIILAARPSMGKTAFALNIATNAAKAGGKALIFSLEMSEELLSERILSTEALVEIKKMREGTIDDEEWTKITDAVLRLDKLDIMIDDTPGISALEIKNKCKRVKMEKGLDLVVIDYLQLMTFEGRAESRQQEISALTRYLKQLAREIDCPIIVLSQLSRAVESRKADEKKPVLSDLRESGSIEQDADIVMFLYREDYYKKEESTRPNECDVIIAKHRNGPTDTVVLTWVGKYTKFSDMVHKNLSI